jgi:opacity protein-like surface antigen
LVVKKLSIFIVLSLFISSMAFAQTAPQRSRTGAGSEETAAAPSKHRISAAIGSFTPLGKYPAFPPYSSDAEFEDGTGFVLAYSYKFQENIEIGAYIDANAYGAKELSYGPYKTTLEISSMIIGLSFAAIFPYNERLSFLGGLKTGYASNSQTIETKSPMGNTKKEDDGEAFAFTLEAAARYKLGSTWELGLSLGYTYLKQESGGGDVDLSGISVLLSLGYNF